MPLAGQQVGAVAEHGGGALVISPVVAAAQRVHVAQQGGHVLEPVTGLHANVWVFDFKSLYPSLIRTFNIDPLSYVPSPRPEVQS